MRFLSLEDIIKINHRHIVQGGGELLTSNNVRAEGSLEWVLEAIQYPLFDYEPYPTIEEKAAILAWTIIGDHAFFDGNKRTGMTTLIVFLRLNRYKLNATIDEVVNVAVEIATAGSTGYTREQLVDWTRRRMTPEGSPLQSLS